MENNPLLRTKPRFMQFSKTLGGQRQYGMISKGKDKDNSKSKQSVNNENENTSSSYRIKTANLAKKFKEKEALVSKKKDMIKSFYRSQSKITFRNQAKRREKNIKRV